MYIFAHKEGWGYTFQKLTLVINELRGKKWKCNPCLKNLF
jgi:hypothetical protein